MKRRPWILLALLFITCLLIPDTEALGAALPQGKTIAVLVRGTPSHAAAARSLLVRALLDGGYRAVDEQQLEKIRRSKAAALALEGDVDAILQLGRSFGFSVLLSGTVTVPKPVRNEFGLFTATASVSVTACHAADGRQIMALTDRRRIATSEEAAQKAAEKAAASAGTSYWEKGPQDSRTAGFQYTVIVSR